MWVTRLVTTARIYLRWGAVSVVNTWRLRQNARRLSAVRGVLPIRIDSEVGLFGQLSWCLLIAENCRQCGLKPRLSLVGPQYGDHGENWVPFLFGGAATAGSAASEPLSIRHYHDLLPLLTDFNPDLSLDQAYQLQQRFFPVHEEILAQVDRFVSQHFHTSPVIGCHFRGTDKSLEAVRVSYDEMTAALKKQLADQAESAGLFIATDEAAFIEHIRAALPGVSIVAADHRRSNNGQALHLRANQPGREHAVEALIDCLPLPRCDSLVKSPSLLSSWAKIFNPSLSVTLVGSPNPDTLWFPESKLHRQSTPS